MLDHEYACMHDDILDRIQSTHQDKNTLLKSISNVPNENEYQFDAVEICDDKIQKKKRNISKKLPKHTLQRQRQKISVDYELHSTIIFLGYWALYFAGNWRRTKTQQGTVKTIKQNKTYSIIQDYQQIVV